MLARLASIGLGPEDWPKLTNKRDWCLLNELVDDSFPDDEERHAFYQFAGWLED